ncbi:hypothetical protein BAE44_0023731 [Dichanthelium oligosanthes]|uniref:DUF1618 domain-containing protein n=1 Tax=Dichanthelium oligosanthes TaxID=888268 RepID=A0A1E5UQV0_9POAL|nr:hypothetical protein BAE44_0023731 [Dichanthelium oligosanthes]
MSSAAAFPNRAMLEPFVLRRDTDKSFPDETKAPIRASGTTFWDAPFRFAFTFAKPPHISHLYAHLPGFPGPKKERPLAMLATHRHLALFRVGTEMSGPLNGLVQDFFIYSATNNPDCPLKALPPCTEPGMDYSRTDGRLPRRRRSSPKEGAPARRLLMTKSMGLLCRGEEEFAVAELQLYKFRLSKVYADIYLFIESGGPEPGKWNSMRVPILLSDNPYDTWQLCSWQTDAVIPVDRWLCWIDYCRGILFCDVFRKPAPTVSFLRFPLDKFPGTYDRSRACSWLYRGVSAIYAGRALKFIDVARHDDIGYGALKPGAGFTITCYTLTLGSTVWNTEILGSKVWKEDCTLTSDELWSDGGFPDYLPHEVLMLPQVDIDRPHVVHFLVSEYRYAMKKMWLVTIDMSSRAVRDYWQYTNGREDIGTEAEELTDERSSCPRPFLVCEFPKYFR